MEIVRVGTLQYERSGNIKVPHAFTTRLGGVSEGCLASLNLGIHRGDSIENVRKNYEILGNALKIDTHNTVLSTQTHSAVILEVGMEQAGAGLYKPEMPVCDGLITAVPGVSLMVFTADCTPVLLWDAVTGAVGAFHAGWRGTVGNIAGKGVAAMNKAFDSKPEDIRAAIGPNIGQCCFETDADVPNALLEAYGEEILPFIERKGEKFFPDLKKINAFALQKAGVKSIDPSESCTHCAPEVFWSARITGKNRGSQGAIILCQGEPQ